MMGEASGICRLDDEVVGQFASKRKVHHVGVWSFQIVIDSPRDSQTEGILVSRRHIGKSVGTWHARTWRKIGLTQQAGKAWRCIYAENASRIADRRRQPPRTLPVERIDDSLAEVVVVESVTEANRTLAPVAQNGAPEAAIRVGRVGDGETRREILVVPGPVRLLSICLAGKSECKVRLVNYALIHIGDAILKPLVHTYGGCYLVPSGLVGRLQ